MTGFLAQQVLVVRSGAERRRVLLEQAVQMGLMVVGQRIQRCLGSTARFQDSSHGRQREGPIAHGSLQRRDHVVAWVVGAQRENPFRLVLAVSATSQQAFQKATAVCAELCEALGQLLQAVLRIAGWLTVFAVLAGRSPFRETSDDALPRRTTGHG